MYRSVRKKVAESVSKLDSPEHYDWNKWLREPDSDEYYIDSLATTVLNTDDINVWPVLPSTRDFTFDLPKIKLSKAFKQLSIKKEKTSKIFFSFPKPSLREVKEILSQAQIDYSLSVSSSGKGAIFRLSEGNKKKTSELSTEVLIREFYLMAPGLFNFPMLLPSERVYSVAVSLDDKVEILDLLTNLKTEVINVELLNSENFIKPVNGSNSTEIKFQALQKPSAVKKVEVVQLETLLHSIQEQKKLVSKISFEQLPKPGIPTEVKIPSTVKNKLKILSVKNIKVAAAKIKQGVKIDDKILTGINSYSFRNKQHEITDDNTDILSRDLEAILQPVINFTKPEKEKIYDFLYAYQKPAADFLSERQTALLNDETGTGKTLEIIAALKILFRKKDISNAVIVCRKEEAGWAKRNPMISDESLSGWYDHLQKYSPAITAAIIYDNAEHEWKNPAAVKIITYQQFSEALEKNLISLNELSHRGCLIIDDVEDFPDLSLNPSPKYLWMVSGRPSEGLKDKIAVITDSDELPESYGRTKEELADSMPFKVIQDYWIEMDPDQKLEYEKALESGREKIYDLVQAGNPFLVQSNVFTLIHQLTQIGNFHGEKESSGKSELLLHHVKNIQKRGKKVFVYSQYDRQGTQRLEKLFTKNGIKYVVYQTGLSLKETEDAIKNFANNKGITVFLAGMKAVNSKINLANVPYLIHFDQWWSPVTTWQAEERINGSTDNPVNKKLNTYNYYIKNSIDEKIRLKLAEKGLDSKLLFDLLSSEGMYSLMSNEDWLEVLELVEPKDPASIKKMKKEHLEYTVNLTTDNFSHKVKAFLGRIGYKNVSFKTAFNPDEMRLYASALKNSIEVKAAVQCLTAKIVTRKMLKDFTDSLVTNTEKIFVFTTGEFEPKLVKNPGDERIVLIDKNLVSNYFYIFNLI